MYKQCELTKRIDGYPAFMTSWVRSKIAVPGNVIDKLEDTDTGRIEYGWTVLTASATESPERLLMKQSRDYKKTRIASDI